MISALNKLADGTVELTITIPWKRIKPTYQKVLTKLAKEVELKGFRKGKAPQTLVEKTLGKTKIYEETLKTLLPQVYVEAIKEQKVKPIVTPKVEVLVLSDKKDWQIKATTCETPLIKLGDYRGEVKKALAADKIWVPGKDQEKASTDQASQDQRLRKTLTVLLKIAEIKVSQVLVTAEVNRMLAQLIDQTHRLGLTIEEYLASLGKTQAELRKEYERQAEETLKLEFILAAIAKKEKVDVKEKEVEAAIEAIPDQKAKKAMATPTQKAYIRQLLTKRAVIDKLMKL